MIPQQKQQHHKTMTMEFFYLFVFFEFLTNEVHDMNETLNYLGNAIRTRVHAFFWSFSIVLLLFVSCHVFTFKM